MGEQRTLLISQKQAELRLLILQNKMGRFQAPRNTCFRKVNYSTNLLSDHFSLYNYTQCCRICQYYGGICRRKVLYAHSQNDLSHTFDHPAAFSQGILRHDYRQHKRNKEEITYA